MNNEPVAWLDKTEGILSFDYMGAGFVPLYTHPHSEESVKVKELTLTDEEIEELAEYHGIDSLYETGRLDFARAILRKAQEK